MNKKVKLYFIVATSALMLTGWALLFFTGTREQDVNYWWQVAMGVTALLYAALGIGTAAHWGWLKSGIGRAIFFISLGLAMWGFGQLGWSYYLFADPNTEAVPSHIPDYIYFSALPLWFYGVLTLTKATGARYGIRKTSGKVLVVLIAAIMSFLSYYFLVEVARGSADYFTQPFLDIFFDLGYSIGDAILLTIVVVILALSWKMLGGRFKVPITTILIGFVFLYLADFSYSYTNGKEIYYNGNIADLFFFLMVGTLGLGLAMLDPTHLRKSKKAATALNLASQQAVTQAPTTPVTTVENPAATPEFLRNNPTAPYAHPHDNSEQKEN